MIARHWRGLVKPGHADRYVEHLRAETFPQLAKLPGFIDAVILRRETPRGTEFLIATSGESIEAIQRFSGPDVEVAVVPATVQPLLIEYDHRARHYDVIR